MRVYLAARYSRKDELLGYATELAELGIEVTSRWIQGLHEIPPEGIEVDSHEHYQWCAEDDLADLDAADVLVAFTEPEGLIAGRGRGGRHVELGYAIAKGKPVLICGHRENVFCHLSEIEFTSNWLAARNAIVAEAMARDFVEVSS